MWMVKSEGADGKIVSIAAEDWAQVGELREEILRKGIQGWIEDEAGRLVCDIGTDDDTRPPSSVG